MTKNELFDKLQSNKSGKTKHPTIVGEDLYTNEKTEEIEAVSNVVVVNEPEDPYVEYRNEDGTYNLEMIFDCKTYEDALKEYKKEYMSRYLHYKNEYLLYMDELEELQDAKTRLSSSMGNISYGGKSSIPSKPSEKWISIDTNMSYMIDLIEHSARESLMGLLEIEEIVYSLKNDLYRYMAEEYFLRGQNWTFVAKALGRSRQHVSRYVTRMYHILNVPFDEEFIQSIIDFKKEYGTSNKCFRDSEHSSRHKEIKQSNRKAVLVAKQEIDSARARAKQEKKEARQAVKDQVESLRESFRKQKQAEKERDLQRELHRQERNLNE